MNSNPLEAPPETDAEETRLRVCQACGDPALLQTHASGAPTLLDGHYTRNCDDLNQYVCSFQSGAFGLAIPDQTQSVIWQFQTGGLRCNTRNIRGTYVPLTSPSVFADNVDPRRIPDPDSGDSLISLPSKLAIRNYELNTSTPAEEETYYRAAQDDPDQSLEYVWTLIDERLPFTYEPAAAPDGYPDTEEAWKWIRITGITKSVHADADADRLIAGTDITPLVGERMVFVYPNSD